MAIQDFLEPENVGKQLWQVLASNLTRGDHPYNFEGICQALVSQWFLELRFASGKQPDELGRYLLKGDLAGAGYGGLAKSQHEKYSLEQHSGGTLRLEKGLAKAMPVESHDLCSLCVLSFLTGIDQTQIQGLEDGLDRVRAAGMDNPRIFCLQLSLKGMNGWLLSKLFGAEWGHAVGIHCDGTHLFVFEPNYGTFKFSPTIVNVQKFFRDLWELYSPSAGTRLEEVTQLG
jgi:hypothetical protein